MNKPKLMKAGIVDVSFGKDVTVIEPANLYGCSIGDNSFIGPFVEIQCEVSIGKNCRIQSHAFICELVSIGDNCFISHGAMFINDTFQSGGPSYATENSAEKGQAWLPTIIGNNVSIGTNATILPVTICDKVVIGAGSVVTKDICHAGIYAGNPAVKIRAL